MVNATAIRNKVRKLMNDYGSTITITPLTLTQDKWGDKTEYASDIYADTDLWLTLDDTSGTAAVDKSASGNDGTYQQDASGLTISGKLDTAINFNGTCGDRALTYRYLLNDDAATTTVVNDGVGSDADSSQNTNLMSSLVGWWKCEETSGTTITDSSPLGNDGTSSVDASTITTTGLVNNALNFSGIDGAGNYIDLGDNSSFEFGSSDFTIGAWIYKTAHVQKEVIFSKYKAASGTREFEFFVGNGYIGLRTSADGDNLIGSASSSAITLDQWNYVMASKSGTTVTYYINGVQAGTTTAEATLAAADAHAYIGAVQSSTTTPDHEFNGKLDEVMVFKRAVSLTEHQRIYNSGSGTSSNVVEQSPMGSKALYFNGSSDIINMGAIGTPTDYFAFHAWIKPESVSSEQHLMVKGSADGNNTLDIRVGIDSSGYLVFEFNNGSYHTFTSTSTLTAGVWQQVAVTYDTYLSSNNIKMYINGTLDRQQSDDVADGTDIPNNTSSWYIGDLPDNSGTYKGYMADMRINKSQIFPAHEVEATYNSGNGTEEMQDYITLASNVSGSLTSGFSIAFWMKTTNTHYTNLLIRDKNGTLAFLGFNSSSNRWKYETDDNNFGGDSAVLTTTIADGAWHHYVHTYVINGANVDWNIYVDGTLESSASHTKPNVQDTISYRYIGIQGNQGRYIYGEAFKGQLDDLRIFTDKILDTTEIANLVTYGIISTVGIPYNIFSGSFNYQPVGDISEADLVLLLKDSETVAPSGDIRYKVTYKTVDYDIISVENIKLNDVVLAKQLILKKRQ